MFAGFESCDAKFELHLRNKGKRNLLIYKTYMKNKIVNTSNSNKGVVNIGDINCKTANPIGIFNGQQLFNNYTQMIVSCL